MTVASRRRGLQGRTPSTRSSEARREIVALVFVAGYAPNPGESCGDASSLAPGGSLAETLERLPLSDGGVDTYIAQDKYHRQFAEDLPEQETRLMAATQHPIPEAALFEPSGDNPLWRSVS